VNVSIQFSVHMLCALITAISVNTVYRIICNHFHLCKENSFGLITSILQVWTKLTETIPDYYRKNTCIKRWSSFNDGSDNSNAINHKRVHMSLKFGNAMNLIVTDSIMSY